MKTCEQCNEDSGAYALCDVCHGKWQAQTSELPYFKEMGVANPNDPGGSTAHVRDIQDRRWHPKEKRTFSYSKEKPKTYFFKKG